MNNRPKHTRTTRVILIVLLYAVVLLAIFAALFLLPPGEGTARELDVFDYMYIFTW